MHESIADTGQSKGKEDSRPKRAAGMWRKLLGVLTPEVAAEVHLHEQRSITQLKANPYGSWLDFCQQYPIVYQ